MQRVYAAIEPDAEADAYSLIDFLKIVCDIKQWV